MTNSLSGSADGSVFQARDIGAIFVAHETKPVVPQTCPLAPSLFVDRTVVLEQLVELCATTRQSPLLLVFEGPAGAGKSALVLRLAAATRESFPDGQIYVDLRRHRRGSKVDLSDLVTRFLRALDIRGDSLSWDLDDKVGLLRSLLHAKRVLIVVDHVAFAEHVTEWLPDGPGCVVAVTTSRELHQLRKYRPVRVRVEGLAEPDGVELLAEYCGTERIDAEPAAAAALVRAYGGLPAALELVGGWLDEDRSLSLARAATELTGEVEAEMAKALDRVLDDLPEQARRLFALLGVHPGTDIALPAVAALMPNPESQLHELRRAYLVDWDGKRVRLRDFAAAHTTATAEEHLSREGREMAGQRLVRHYLELASAADLAKRPDRLRLGSYAGPPQAAKLDAEHDNLVGAITMAADSGMLAEAWQLCEVLFPYFQDCAQHGAWVDTTRIGVKAAEALQDPAAESRMRSQLARALSETREFAEAKKEAQRGIVLAEQTGNQRLLAAAEEFAGKVWVADGERDLGIAHLERGLRINTTVGRPRSIAIVHLALAKAHHLNGDNEKTLFHADEALPLFESLKQSEPRNRGSVLLTKAAALGRSPEAVAVLKSAIDLLRQDGARRLEAEALELLASLDVAREREHLTAAMEIHLGLRHPEAVARVASRLSP